MDTSESVSKLMAKSISKEINVTKVDLPPLDEYIMYLKEIWSNGWITNNGKFVQLLEKELEKYLNVKNLLIVSNGTLALQIALKSLEINGEVITTPLTFAATTNAIIWENLTPVFADIDSKTYNIDPRDIEKKINNNTSAILAVHVYGNPCYVDEIKEIADDNNLKLIYDAAHAFGVEYKDKSVLDYGDISTISFHATKIFNTVEGGAIIVKDKNLIKKIKLLRNHGIKSEEQVVLPGTNAKMNELQAAIGLCNLKDVNNNIMLRKNIYSYYKEKLGDLKGLKFQKISASSYNYSYMPVCFQNSIDRDKVYSELYKNGINSRKYFYPLTVDFDYFKNKDHAEYNLKTASDVVNKILCLPIYPNLNITEINRIIAIIERTLKT
ncbi:DegT/DnrJ/EryC1/StrS family aminotransferase [Methanobacterium oryzae]|uniref:DegT/DnrJ/EryC1/StrS family aminotransferase n=1 Tax=Methanobacterium oryzae TaxID=69540 RepID=UPI003D19676D